MSLSGVIRVDPGRVKCHITLKVVRFVAGVAHITVVHGDACVGRFEDNTTDHDDDAWPTESDENRAWFVFEEALGGFNLP